MRESGKRRARNSPAAALPSQCWLRKRAGRLHLASNPSQPTRYAEAPIILRCRELEDTRSFHCPSCSLPRLQFLSASSRQQLALFDEENHFPEHFGMANTLKWFLRREFSSGQSFLPPRAAKVRLLNLPSVNETPRCATPQLGSRSRLRGSFWRQKVRGAVRQEFLTPAMC